MPPSRQADGANSRSASHTKALSFLICSKVGDGLPGGEAGIGLSLPPSFAESTFSDALTSKGVASFSPPSHGVGHDVLEIAKPVLQTEILERCVLQTLHCSPSFRTAFLELKWLEPKWQNACFTGSVYRAMGPNKDPTGPSAPECFCPLLNRIP